MSRHFRSCQSGFTLVEAIIVIVITGILAGMVAVFITSPVQGYVDSVRRAELTDAADVALRRITRDVRLALPNSLREVVANQSFEFIMTKTGGRYRDSGDGSDCAVSNCLSFTNSGSTTFDILGTSPTNPPNIANDDSIVVYNLGAGYAPADAYAGGNLTSVTVASGTPYVATMTSNVFATQSPPLPSPSSRFQVVDQDDLVVRYVCTGGELRRFSGCTLASSPDCSGTPGALLAGSATVEPKATCVIEYQANATGRNGLLYIELTLTDTPSDERVTLFQQIHVDNSP